MKDSANDRRPCPRCLTRDLDWGAYFDNMHKLIDSMDESIKTPAHKYEERLSVCKSCDLLLDGMCKACGCYVELRAAARKTHCPYDKW